MAIEKEFIKNGLKKARINEYLGKHVERAGYGGMNINRTPMGTQITVYAEKPGMIIGKGGRIIQRLTTSLSTEFDLDNPQIDVQEVKMPELNAQMMATRLAGSLERGWYFRRAGHSTLNQIIGAGALGCEIILSGKLTGQRSRSEKFISGYIKHCGHPAEELVDIGYAVAKKKLGAVGVQVRIIPSGVELPDNFKLNVPAEPEPEISAAAQVDKETETAEAPVEKETVEAGDKELTEDAPSKEDVTGAGDKELTEDAPSKKDVTGAGDKELTEDAPSKEDVIIAGDEAEKDKGDE